ncbi:MAG: hydrogenase maturation nickel metallochaperone HypA/HybF [Thermoanaerobaculia bacterium]
MHEYSIIQSLVDAVEVSVKPHSAQVHRIDVRIGELSGVDTVLLATAYEVFREGTCCAAATMTIDRVPARWQCPKCSRDIARGAVLRCPTCHEPAQLAAGDEIILQRIELEVA